MKKFYSFLMVMMALVCFSLTSAAKTITLTIDNPEAASFRNPLDEFNVGQWDDNNSVSFTFDGNISIPVTANTGYELTKATDGDEIVFASATTSYTINTDGFNDGAVIAFTTAEREAKKLVIYGDASQVYVTTDSYAQLGADDQVDGAWNVALTSEWGSTTITALEGYLITKVEDANGAQWVNGAPTGSCSISSYGLSSGTTTITVTSASTDDLYDGHATVNVNGDGFKVAMRLAGQYQSVVLNSGANQFDYDSSSAFPITIQHAYSSYYNPQYIYKVTVDGTELTPVDGVFTISSLEPDAVIDIDVDVPAVDIPVSILFADEESKGALRNVKVDYETVDPSTYAEFTSQTGKNISFTFDHENYDVALTSNGEPVTISYGNYSCSMINTEGYTFMVTATKKQPITVNIICENWEHLVISSSYSGENPYELTGVESTIVVEPSAAYTYFKAESGWRMVDITDPETGESYGSTSFYVTEGMSLFIEIEEYKRDNSFTLYTEPIEWGYLKLTLSPQTYETREEITPEPGYSTIKFADADRPFTISGYASAPDYAAPEVYLNNVLCENNYGAYPALEEVKDGDVIKIMSVGAPKYTVGYQMAAPLGVTIKQDMTLAVDPSETTEQFAGTLIAITPAEGEEITVKASLGDSTVDVTPGEDGVFYYTVEANVEFVIAPVESAIAGIEADAQAPADVYNLQGVCVLRAATAEQIEALPAGIYVSAGRKIVVK